jgi:phenylalanyl-tRNA synthetase beta chain
VDPVSEPVFAPGRAGKVILDGVAMGRIGQVHPSRLRPHKIETEVAYVELDLAPLVEASRPRQFAGLHKFPVIQRDVTVLVPLDMTWQAVKSVVAPEQPEYVDEYVGKGVPAGHKSLTLRLVVANPDRTPTEDEAAELEARVLRRLERKLGAKRRD